MWMLQAFRHSMRPLFRQWTPIKEALWMPIFGEFDYICKNIFEK